MIAKTPTSIRELLGVEPDYATSMHDLLVEKKPVRPLAPRPETDDERYARASASNQQADSKQVASNQQADSKQTASNEQANRARAALISACSVLAEHGSKQEQAEAKRILACSLLAEPTSKQRASKRGGDTRAKVLTPERRSEIARIANAARRKRREKSTLGFAPLQHD